MIADERRPRTPAPLTENLKALAVVLVVIVVMLAWLPKNAFREPGAATPDAAQLAPE